MPALGRQHVRLDALARVGTYRACRFAVARAYHDGLPTSDPVRAASVPALPGTRCDGLPCWHGLALAAGEPLSLFVLSPMPSTSVPQPDALYGYALQLPLAALVTAGDAPRELRWRASSSDQSLATARIVGSHLLVEPEPGAEGMVTIEVTATDTRELSATLRFEVRVEFYWPWRIGGWRGALPRSAGDD